eukprot:TRINITY_DN4136_c0_g1_i5.p2 TRINITY_DN4136_c0_g1~~TRINITY_DN4136_c0_g1_i5.p2  ORF type:complete len:126 (-),score=18.07 TRINITY_DN4136_c0_g1_i5:301-678(-)
MPSLVGSEMCIRDRYQRRVHGVLKSEKPKTTNSEMEKPKYCSKCQIRHVYPKNPQRSRFHEMYEDSRYEKEHLCDRCIDLIYKGFSSNNCFCFQRVNQSLHLKSVDDAKFDNIYRFTQSWIPYNN